MPEPACHAPYASLYFQPDGTIRTCCTSPVPLGVVRPDMERPIRSALDGPTVARQKQALDRGDFSVGCRECGVPASHGLRHVSLAASFDRYGSSTPPAYPRVMDFALSSHCNLQCVMCNGDLSSSIRSGREQRPPLPHSYGESFFAELAEFLPHLERAHFKGGEPFLSRDTQRVWDLMLDLGVDCEVVVTTNATTWSPRVERYVRDLKMHVVASVDGMTSATLESIRVGVHHEQMWTNIDHLQRVTEETGRGLTISWCLVPQNVQELGDFFVETTRRGCYANVVIVNQPPAYDLTYLPPDDLRRIVQDLNTDRRGRGPDLSGDARRTWRDTVKQLLAHVEQPMQIRPTHLTSVDADAAHLHQAEGHAELEAWASAPPIVVRDRAGYIVQVDVPPWAEWLRPREWAGRQLSDALGLVAEAVGLEPAVDLRHTSNGVIEATITFRLDNESGRVHTLRTLTFPSRGPHEQFTTHLIASADLQRA